MRVFWGLETAAAALWTRRSAVALAVATLVGSGSGCDKAACAGVEGSCLALHVEGEGSYDRLEGVLTAPSGMVLKSGDAATEVTLPIAVQILPPPPPFSTALAGAIRVNAYRGTLLAASGMVTMSWPDGARIDVKLGVIAVPGTTTADMDKTRTDLGDM